MSRLDIAFRVADIFAHGMIPLVLVCFAVSFFPGWIGIVVATGLVGLYVQDRIETAKREALNELKRR